MCKIFDSREALFARLNGVSGLCCILRENEEFTDGEMEVCKIFDSQSVHGGSGREDALDGGGWWGVVLKSSFGVDEA